MRLIFWDCQIAISLTWTLDDFKAAISKDISNSPISDANLKVLSRAYFSLFLMESSTLRDQAILRMWSELSIALNFYLEICDVHYCNSYDITLESES